MSAAVEMSVTATMEAATMEAATMEAATVKASSVEAAAMTAAAVTATAATPRKGRARRRDNHGNGNCHDEPGHWHPPTDVRETRNVY